MGSIFVLSAPSGTGKSTLAKRLVSSVPNLIFSISCTTRTARPGEAHGREYFFVDNGEFDRMIQEDNFLEWVKVYANRYGTSRPWIQEQLDKGLDILLDIETIGARNIKQMMPSAVMIFLMPPSSQELARRLHGRGDTGEEQMTIRLGHARCEMEEYPIYDYLVVNDDLEAAYKRLESIILASRCRQGCMDHAARQILDSFA